MVEKERNGVEVVKTFSKRLKIAILFSDLSQKELAEKAGVTPASITSYAKGTKNPTMETLVKIADALNISTDWLCGIENKGYRRNSDEIIGEWITP